MAREESRLRRERVTVSEGDDETHHCIASIGLRDGGQKTEAHPEIGSRDGDQSIDLEREGYGSCGEGLRYLLRERGAQLADRRSIDSHASEDGLASERDTHRVSDDVYLVSLGYGRIESGHRLTSDYLGVS